MRMKSGNAVYSEIPSSKNLYHIEISQVICSEMKTNWTVLIDIWSLTLQELGFF